MGEIVERQGSRETQANGCKTRPKRTMIQDSIVRREQSVRALSLSKDGSSAVSESKTIACCIIIRVCSSSKQASKCAKADVVKDENGKECSGRFQGYKVHLFV